MVSERQIRANRLNWAKRRGLTEAGRQRLRQAARRDRPWEHSTGPRTERGKARSRLNAETSGERSAAVRVVEQLGRNLNRYTALHFEMYRMFDGLPTCPGTHASRATGSFADMLIAARLLKHLPCVNELSDPDACLGWLAEHRRLAERPLTRDECDGRPSGFLCAFPISRGLTMSQATARAFQALATTTTLPTAWQLVSPMRSPLPMAAAPRLEIDGAESLPGLDRACVPPTPALACGVALRANHVRESANRVRSSKLDPYEAVRGAV